MSLPVYRFYNTHRGRVQIAENRSHVLSCIILTVICRLLIVDIKLSVYCISSLRLPVDAVM